MNGRCGEQRKERGWLNRCPCIKILICDLGLSTEEVKLYDLCLKEEDLIKEQVGSRYCVFIQGVGEIFLDWKVKIFFCCQIIIINYN